MARANQYFIFIVLAVSYLQEIHGHGMLMDPINRGSAWRVGYKTPVNKDDDGNYCGGIQVKVDNGGKCGVCGDNYVLPQPRPNENGGKYGTGIIMATYEEGQKINLIVRITTNHVGYFRYSICPLKDSKDLETDECFAEYPLKLENGSDRYVLESRDIGDYRMSVHLPKGLTCEHCVIKWDYIAGNTDENCKDGWGGNGCGPQATFKTCSDIAIKAK